MSQSRREKSCPPLFSLMPCCQLAVRSRQELGAMLINISAPDTFNQQPQLGQCICKKVNEYLFWFPSNLVFGRDHCLCRWQSTMLLTEVKQINWCCPQRGRRQNICATIYRSIYNIILVKNKMHHENRHLVLQNWTFFLPFLAFFVKLLHGMQTTFFSLSHRSWSSCLPTSQPRWARGQPSSRMCHDMKVWNWTMPIRRHFPQLAHTYSYIVLSS